MVSDQRCFHGSQILDLLCLHNGLTLAFVPPLNQDIYYLFIIFLSISYQCGPWIHLLFIVSIFDALMLEDVALKLPALWRCTDSRASCTLLLGEISQLPSKGLHRNSDSLITLMVPKPLCRLTLMILTQQSKQLLGWTVIIWHSLPLVL